MIYFISLVRTDCELRKKQATLLYNVLRLLQVVLFNIMYCIWSYYVQIRL